MTAFFCVNDLQSQPQSQLIKMAQYSNFLSIDILLQYALNANFNLTSSKNKNVLALRFVRQFLYMVFLVYSEFVECDEQDESHTRKY